MDTKVRGGILLVAGTAIGAGMLALPVATGQAGFLPAAALLVGFWVFMTYTALLMLEVNTWTGAGTNLITMARATLGSGGAAVSWTAYLFLLYALLTAYIAGSGALLHSLWPSSLPAVAYALPAVVLFAVLLTFGMRPFDYLNRMLMGGLVLAYLAMIGLLSPHVTYAKLTHMEWSATFRAAALVATSFGFHIIIPSLYNYLEGHIAKLKRILLIGSTLPLLVYLLWQAIALGILPLTGADGLQAGYQRGASGTQLLVTAVPDFWLAAVIQLFALCAIITSFLGVALSLHDFLADGLSVEQTGRGRAWLLALTFVPPCLIAAIDPAIFLGALEYAGAFGVLLLLGILPVLMVWRGRYYQKRYATYRAPGGKLALSAAFLFAAVIMVYEVFKL